MALPEHKIIPMSRVEFVAKQLAVSGRAILTTNGCFDLLHLGHLASFELSRSLGTVLWVGVNGDASFRQNKRQDALFPSDVRARMIAALEIVDYVTVFEENDPSAFITKARPAFHVKGSDYTPAMLKETSAVNACGARLMFATTLRGFSTSEIRKKIRNDHE